MCVDQKKEYKKDARVTGETTWSNPDENTKKLKYSKAEQVTDSLIFF